MEIWKFTIRIDIYIIDLKMGNISIADEQKYISQIAAIDVYV